MESENAREDQARIWIPIPEDYTRIKIGLEAAGGILLLLILVIWGYKLCIAAGIVMIATTVLVHFLLQKRITLANIIFYFSQGEMYLISLNKADEKLYAYLHGQTEEKPAPTETAVDFLLKMADRSVIWRILKIYNIRELKSSPENKKYRINTQFDLPRYTYDSVLGVDIHEKRFEDFEGLIHTLQYIEES